MEEENRMFVMTTNTRRSEKFGVLAAALAKAQGEFSTVGKTSKANVATKTGGAYSYSYADLADFMRMVRGPLSRNGIAILQPACYTQDGVVVVETLLLHESEQFIATDLHMVPADRSPQAIGSCITYARKYALAALLGVVAEEEDDDGNAAHGRRVITATSHPARTNDAAASAPRTEPPATKATNAPVSAHRGANGGGVGPEDLRRGLDAVAADFPAALGPLVETLVGSYGASADRPHEITRGTYAEALAEIKAAYSRARRATAGGAR